MYEAGVCTSSLDSFLHRPDKLAYSDVLQELAQVSRRLLTPSHACLPLVLSAASIGRSCNESVMIGVMNGKGFWVECESPGEEVTTSKEHAAPTR
jgi:hypothetical protein